MKATPFTAELYWVHRNRWLLGLAAVPLLLGLAAIVAGFAVKSAFFFVALFLVVFGGGVFMDVFQRSPRPREEVVLVRAAADGVHLGDTFLPRDEIRDGFVIPGEDPGVKLRRHRALPVELRGCTVAEARALLRTLGLDASQTAATFRIVSPVLGGEEEGEGMTVFVGAIGVCIASFGGAMFASDHHIRPLTFFCAITAITAITSLVLAAFKPTTLSVGADGIMLRWIGPGRFIGYGDVEDVSVSERPRNNNRSTMIGLEVMMRSGRKQFIPVDGSGEDLSIIAERIREARKAIRRGGVAADAALLRRGDRTVSAWVTSLGSIGSGTNADMRTAPLPRERLFRIVESPSTDSVDRAAAAVALGTDLDDDGRARLAGVADTIAAPRLRIVLEKAADGASAAEMEAALAELAEGEKLAEEESRKRRRWSGRGGKGA